MARLYLNLGVLRSTTSVVPQGTGVYFVPRASIEVCGLIDRAHERVDPHGSPSTAPRKQLPGSPDTFSSRH